MSENTVQAQGTPGANTAASPASQVATDPTAVVAANPDATNQSQPTAPEKYEFKAPEGVELDKNVVALFEPIAKELKLPGESAQKIVSLYAEKIMPHVLQAQADSWAKQVDDWSQAVKSDKELGGEGFAANVEVAQKAIARFGSPALKEILESTGLGNHPELVRFCMRIGKAISEDSAVLPGKEPQVKKSYAEILYGSTQQ